MHWHRPARPADSPIYGILCHCGQLYPQVIQSTHHQAANEVPSEKVLLRSGDADTVQFAASSSRSPLRHRPLACHRQHCPFRKHYRASRYGTGHHSHGEQNGAITAYVRRRHARAEPGTASGPGDVEFPDAQHGHPSRGPQPLPGEARTDAKEAAVVTNAARTYRTLELGDEVTAELTMLAGFDQDLADEVTRTSNRIRGLLPVPPQAPPQPRTRPRPPQSRRRRPAQGTAHGRTAGRRTDRRRTNPGAPASLDERHGGTPIRHLERFKMQPLPRTHQIHRADQAGCGSSPRQAGVGNTTKIRGVQTGRKHFGHSSRDHEKAKDTRARGHFTNETAALIWVYTALMDLNPPARVANGGTFPGRHP